MIAARSTPLSVRMIASTLTVVASCRLHWFGDRRTIT